MVSLINGTNIVFFDQAYTPFSLVTLFEKYNITIMCGTPTLFRHISTFITRGQYKANLSKIVLSGECITNAEKATYTYNAKKQLEKIGTDSTEYTFTYDAFGNTTQIKAGSYILVSYTYAANNGKLSSMTYGNNDKVTYFYDHLDRIDKICYDNTTRFVYQYTSDGKLHSVEDVASDIGYLYGYYGDPGVSGGEMRVMGGGYSGACAFFVYLTRCPSVVGVPTPIPGGGTATITPSSSAASGYAVQIKTSAGQPFKSQRVHFN